MANLVSPGYSNSALVGMMLSPTEERVIEFKGLNKRSYIEDGEMSDMWNLSPDSYPLLMPRKPRGRMEVPEGILRPLQILRRFDKIGIIAIDEADPEEVDPPITVSFYYDGEKISEVTGLTTETKAVAINNIMCFFPQKTAIDITKEGVQAGTYRSLEASSVLSNKAVTVSNEDARITLSPGHGLKYDDAINIHITSYTPSGSTAIDTDFNISCIVEEVVNDNTIVLPRETFIEMTGAGVTAFSITGTIERSMPQLDFVVEWNNRLWGCNNADNTLYASKLGDPSNWQYYQGTGLDSYYAQQGTDESFTGIAEYSGHLIFFKQNSMTRVYGTSPSNYQITNTKAFGVENGSSRSVLTINDTVYYKSEIGFMAYQGGTPFCISDKLSWPIKNVIAGTEGRKYYASCVIKENGLWKDRLLVFDIGKGVWHMEDDVRFTNACKIGSHIYCASAAPGLVCDTDVFCSETLFCGSEYVEGDVLIINPDTLLQTHAEAEVADPDDPPENYEDMEWMATFGPFDEYLEEHKIYSKLAMRLKANGIASANVYISIDEGPWEKVQRYDRVSTKGDFIPIIPRRCDRYSIKIEGKGNCEIKSLTRRVRKGSFGRL